MPRNTIGLGDEIEVAQHHRLAGSEGTVVAVGDNLYARRPNQNFHIRFHRPTRSVIHQYEIWLDASDVVLVKKAQDGYVPPDDIEKPATDFGE
jgi:hypothetical protein